MKVNTSVLKDMLKAVSGCKPSKILEITNYYELDFIGSTEDSKLTVKENLSVDDLLESKIIRLSSPIKSDSFFNGIYVFINVF